MFFKERELINNLQLHQSMFLKGQSGSNFDEIIDEIAKKFNLEVIDISNEISPEYIYNFSDSLSISNDKVLLKINLFKLDENKQNILLKFFEEPSKNSYIIIYGLTCINTLLTRSYVINIPKYSKEDLKQFSLNEKILHYCETPGQILKIKDIDNLVNYCKKILTKIGQAHLYNVLNSLNILNDDEFDIFLLILNKVCVEEAVSEDIIKIVQKTSDHIDLMNNKKMFIENMLLNLWRLAKCS
jgi:hypothetical protein